MASPPAPPPPSSSYRPWEDTSPATPPLFLSGRPSLPLPAPLAMADRRPSTTSSAPPPHNPRKRRRLSHECLDRLHLPRVVPPGPSGEIYTIDVRGGDEGGGGGSMYRRGPDAGDIISSAYTKPLNHHFTPQQPPLPPPPPPLQQPPSLPTSRPATPSQRQQQFPFQPPSSLTVLVSSIHNLVLDLASSAPSPTTSNSPLPSPSQITPNQLPSLETLTTCLETIHALLFRLKPTPPIQPQPQYQHSPTPTENQAAYNSHLADLRHSLSTLTLAHSTLKTEHTSLLSAYSRSQTRATTLDRKLLVCTEDNESLSNERERLMGVVEGLEESLLEVRTERDEIRNEMRNSGAQWGAIVHNAGKLEYSAVKVEKALKKEVEELKGDVERLRATGGGGGGCCAAAEEAGEKERIELRTRVRELENCLEELRNEGRGIWELAERISKMGKGISEYR